MTTLINLFFVPVTLALIIAVTAGIPLLIQRYLRNKPYPGSAVWLKTTFKYAAMVGGICFLLGFVGPILFVPDANQGPLLGIFITGPIGFLVGVLIGSFLAFER